jgi:steroid 5-alpha reductase family enzyme
MNGFDGAAFGVNLAVAAAVALAVMLATFGIAVWRGKHRIVDIAWGVGFTAVAIVTFALSADHGDLGRRLLVTVLTAVWGLRLASYIAWRSWGKDEDPRYEQLLGRAPGSRNAYALRIVYLLQAALVWLVSLPVQVAQYIPDGLGVVAWIGGLLWAVGFTFEAVGDWQLQRFKADPANRGRVMDRGLWRYTRHPNYFGDFCVWWGLFLIASQHWAAAPTVVSPLVMSYLLIRGSGKALLERHMSDRPGYDDYVRRTSGFLPLPPRRR